ncbi:MAG: SDR family oxidoreductase [Pseudomonadota bacterium]
MSKLDGKVALVSGSGRGIGRAIALKLAAEGAQLVVNDLEEAPAAETVAAIEAAGGQAVACVGNVCDGDFGPRFVASALEAYGRLDIIVNNAGYTWDGVIHKTGDDQWAAMLEVHLSAPFRILRAAADYLRTSAKEEAEVGRPVHRKVVNISSISGLAGNAGQVNYAAAKAGLVGLTKSLAKEWGRHRINVNCVAFGLIETDMTRPGAAGQGIPEESYQAICRATPLGRAGTPEEAAGAVCLLCLPESDFITGEVLIASGGLMF